MFMVEARCLGRLFATLVWKDIKDFNKDKGGSQHVALLKITSPIEFCFILNRMLEKKLWVVIQT